MTMDAPIMAIGRLGWPKELRHHSDQGSQYFSEPLQRFMADNGVTCSMSQSGNVGTLPPWKAFPSLNIERVKRQGYRTRNRACADVCDYIVRLQNPTHRHSSIGYPSPMQHEKRTKKA